MFISKPVFPQSKEYYSPTQTKAFYALLDLDFSKARVHGKNPTALDFHLKSLAACMEAFFYCDKHLYLVGRSQELKWLDSLAKTPECAEKRFVKAQIKLHWAFLSFAYGEKLSAAVAMRQAYLILKDNIGLYPSHKPTMLYYGLINTFLAEIPDNYQWMANMVGLKGDAELGAKMIEAAKGHHPVLDFERNVWLLVKRPQFEEQEEYLLQICNRLVHEFGTYPTTKAIASFYYLKNKRVENASTLLAGLHYDHVPLFLYIKGLVEYHSLDLNSAANSFQLFAKRNKSENFKKDATLKLAYINWMQGDTVQAHKYLAGIKRKGNSSFYADKQADRLASENFPDRLRLRTRILFDGGKWEEARATLLQWKTGSVADKVEYYYRMARIEQQLDNVENSKRCYKSCIGLCPKEKVYFGPFACLYLAEMYLKESNKILALHYVNVSHEFKDFDFIQSYLAKNTELKKRVK